jgi:hypothetical protein
MKNSHNTETMKNTGEMCMVFDGETSVDLGNFFINQEGEKVLVTDMVSAEKYGHLVKQKIYVRRE